MAYPQQQPYAPGPGFNVPPPQYNPQPPQPQIVVTIPTLGETPVRMICPNCRSDISTRVSSESSIVQHIACFIMCITGACLLCSCVPYCVDTLSDVRHECPSCHAHLGTYKRCH